MNQERVGSKQAQSVEYRASKYDVQTQPYYESIFQWVLRNSKTTETRHLVTTLLPIPADGSVIKVFTGTKDYFLLSSLNDSMTDYIKENPGKCLVGALAVGYLIGKIASRRG